MFVEKYEELTDGEKESFKRAVSLILAKTFIVNRIYDRNQKNFKSNPDYRFIERNIELFKEYLDIAGYNLNKDSNYEVIYLENQFGYNKKRLDKNTTIFLYALRLKYEEEREKVRLNTDIVVTVSSIIDTLRQVGAYAKKPADADIKSALSNLINFNIIQKGEGKLEEPSTNIIILPSILFAITNEKITKLNESIKNIEESEEIDEENEDIGVDEE